MLPAAQALRRFWERIVEPESSIVDEARRYRLRIFTMIFLVAALMTAAITAGYAVRTLSDPDLLLHTISIGVSTAILTSAVWLTRRGHLQPPLLLLCLYGAPANFALVVMRNQPISTHLYDYLALMTVIGGLFLTRRLMLAVFAYNALWMLATPLLASAIPLVYILEGPFLFNVMMLALSLVGVALYQQAERQRSASNERERIFYKSLFEQSNDAIFLLTLDGRNFAANSRAEELLGFTIEEMMSREVAGVVVPQEREASEARRNAMLSGEIHQPYERTFMHKDGHEIPTEVNVAVIRDAAGRPTHIQSIVRDLRDRKRQQSERLELARAEERMGTMRQFVAAISHDFRTSLAQIEMGAHLARRAVEKGNIEAARVKFDNISTGVQHMGDQLENLSTVASLMTLSLERCDINGIVQSLAFSLHEMTRKYGVTLDLALEPHLDTLSIDPDKMHNALKQLLLNAVAHTPSGGRIEVRTYLSSGMVAISVRDEGIGIEAEEIHRLFEPLYRVDFARTVDDGGIGLGLTIVKLVTEAHGGRVEVESTLNQGSLFRILLPTS